MCWAIRAIIIIVLLFSSAIEVLSSTYARKQDNGAGDGMSSHSIASFAANSQTHSRNTKFRIVDFNRRVCNILNELSLLNSKSLIFHLSA